MEEEYPIGRLDHLDLPKDCQIVELPVGLMFFNESALSDLQTFFERRTHELLHRPEDAGDPSSPASGADPQAD